jgi:hypothetical protein
MHGTKSLNPMLNFESYLQYAIENTVKNMDMPSTPRRSISSDVNLGQPQSGLIQSSRPLDIAPIHSIAENCDEKSISNASTTNIGEIVQELDGLQ